MGSNHFGNGMILQVGTISGVITCTTTEIPNFVGGGFNMFQIFFKFHPFFRQDSYFD